MGNSLSSRVCSAKEHTHTQSFVKESAPVSALERGERESALERGEGERISVRSRVSECGREGRESVRVREVREVRVSVCV